jgi:hypothetical protein
MSTILISNLPQDATLDRQAMSAVRGGMNSWLAGLGPLANVNIGVNQNINQYQKVNVNTLNDVGSIGPNFGPLRIDVAPMQLAHAHAAF